MNVIFSAEQSAVVPPPDPVHCQEYVPEIPVGVPDEHKLIGLELKTFPSSGPQTPLTPVLTAEQLTVKESFPVQVQS